MDNNNAKRLLKKQIIRLSENNLDFDSRIALLGEIIQKFVEKNDYPNAFRYQSEKYRIINEHYGPEDIKTERAEMYLKELGIMSSPVGKRVEMCRDFWEQTKQKYGAKSYAISKLVAPLYLLCCEQANELEEMRVLCFEIISTYENSTDIDDLRLVTLCKASNYLYFKSNECNEEISKLCNNATRLFGAENETTLILRHLLGLSYRDPKDEELMALSIETHYKALNTAVNFLGINNRITLLLAHDVAVDYALNGQFDEAIKCADKLSTIIKMTDSSVEKPNIDNAYFIIYSKMGKYKLAEKYSKQALKEEINKYGKFDSDVVDAEIKNLAYSFSKKPSDKKHIKLSNAVSNKLDLSFISFLAVSESDRKAYFTTRQKQNFFRIYSIVTLGYALNNNLSQTAMLMFWENICNRKTFLSDCEFIHNSILRDKSFSEKVQCLQSENNKSSNIIIQRQIIDSLRKFDFNSYSKRINVKEVQQALKNNEILFDFYLLDSINGREYAVVTVTNTLIKFNIIGSIDILEKSVVDFSKIIKFNYTDYFNGLKINPIYSFLKKSGIDKFDTAYIIPDGCLYKLPFDTMFCCKTKYLINPKDIVRNIDNGNSSKSIEYVTAFGDPDFELDLKHSDSQERSGILSKLPGTLVETEILKNLFGEKAIVFTGKDANTYNFLNACFGNIVHIGTHANTDGNGRLFFSGKNNSNNGYGLPDKYGNGYVSSEEIIKLDFANTDLVVLSACETAAGRYEDYLGLRNVARAFKLAGAKQIIASLWTVDDFSTMILFKYFYNFYLESHDASLALDTAKYNLRNLNVNTLKENDLAEVYDILIRYNQTDMYRLIRDRISSLNDEDKPFSQPYYWAGFQIFI